MKAHACVPEIVHACMHVHVDMLVCEHVHTYMCAHEGHTFQYMCMHTSSLPGRSLTVSCQLARSDALSRKGPVTCPPTPLVSQCRV